MKTLRTMSFAEQIRTIKFVNGHAWIMAGIFGCFDNVICRIFQILALLVGMINIFYVFAAKGERSDEMADENLCKAKANALDKMQRIFCFIAILAMLTNGEITITLDWPRVIPAVLFILLGVQDLIVGRTFRKLEDE